MAWEDRTAAEKREARRAGREYARTDDDHTYVVTTVKGTRLTVIGINSARVVAGRDGTYRRADQPEEPADQRRDERMTPPSLTATQWRLLNALDAGGRACTAALIAQVQDATNEDLLRLWNTGLIRATLGRHTVPLDLAAHLAHHGSTMVVSVKLTRAGLRTVRIPANMLLLAAWKAGGGVQALRRVMAHSDADIEAVCAACQAGRIRVLSAVDGQAVSPDEVPRIEVRYLRVLLTDKGRGYVPFREGS